MPRDQILVAGRVSLIKEPVEGSREYDADCSHKVWLGPTLQAVYADSDYHLMCLQCAIEASGGIEEIAKQGKILPGVLEEFANYLRKKYAPDE
jgi:hypothetical protein